VEPGAAVFPSIDRYDRLTCHNVSMTRPANHAAIILDLV
jgi:hypothetical protein